MEALLPQCLSSLITPESIETLDVIIVNDGSKDRSSAIAHEYEANYPHVFKVIDKENGNYGSCINAALPFIKSKYIKILDADDSFETTNLDDYLQLLEKVNVDLVLTNSATYDQNKYLLSEIIFSFPKQKVFKFQDIPPKTFLSMHCVTYNSDIFKRINYHQSEGISYTDMEWVFHPMSAVNSVYYHDKIIYRYLVGREGQTIETATRLKRLSYVAAGVWACLKVFKYIPKDNPAYYYLENLIYERAAGVYLPYLTNKNVKFDLVEFDNKLKKENIELFRKMDYIREEIKGINCSIPIVSLWRIVKKKGLMYIFPQYVLYKLYNATSRLFK